MVSYLTHPLDQPLNIMPATSLQIYIKIDIMHPFDWDLQCEHVVKKDLANYHCLEASLGFRSLSPLFLFLCL